MITNYTIRWFLTIFVGLVFAASGAAKLLGDPVFTAWFVKFGIPLAYMRGLGFLELLGALALVNPLTARYANLGFLCVSIGATAMHLAFGQPVAALLPTALGTAAALAVWGTPGHPIAAAQPQVLAPDAGGGPWLESLAPARA